MGVSFRELREKCQLPVRGGNDVTGLLFGDWASLPFTKLWVDLKLSPDLATVGMLVTGLVGAALHLSSGLALPVGAALLLFYYVLDCVDGEVARFRRVENIKWGYYEYIFHMLVKPLCFLGIGTGLYFQLGRPLYIVCGATAAIAALWLKLFVEVPGIMFTRGVIGAPPGKDRAFRRYAEEVGMDVAAAGDTAASDAVSAGADADTTAPAPSGFPLGLNLVTLRAMATNFDFGLILLVLATVVDHVTGPFELPLFGFTTLRGVWMVYYGVILPLDFLDYLRSYMARGHFPAELERLLQLAHNFRVPPREG